MRLQFTQPGAPCKRHSALPADPGLDRLLADTRLNSTSKAVGVALVRRWAWKKDHCWPADATIAKAVGRSPGHVQRCLRQLEGAGYVERERTEAVPNGRRIWLLWRREAGAGAEPVPAPARSDPPAPARTEAVVIVNPGIEAGVEELPGRSREEPVADPPVAVAADPPRRRPGLDVAGLAAAVAATADPILARELARLTAPPPPPEPPAASLGTPELIARLPGRHDLVMAVARRLSVETGDHKPVSMRSYEAMARAVACRTVPAPVLESCWRQAAGPMARDRGRLLVATWHREAGQFSRSSSSSP